MILTDTWERLVGRLRAEGLPVVYRPTDQVPEFFREAEGWGPGRRVVLVSGCCDWSVVRQEHHHPNADLTKLVAAVDYDAVAQERGHYVGLYVTPADELRCRPADTYSFKTDRYTWATFDRVPSQVAHWFTTNLGSPLPSASLLPFGVNAEGDGKDRLAELAARRRWWVGERLYVNFQNNTSERVALKRHYEGHPLVRFRARPDMPVGDYLEELSWHDYSLCPDGNGLDSYRVLECLYLGVTPVMRRSYFSERLREMFPAVVLLDDLADFDFCLLGRPGPAASARGSAALTVAFWEERIRVAANRIA